jgi:hypothetical protein
VSGLCWLWRTAAIETNHQGATRYCCGQGQAGHPAASGLPLRLRSVTAVRVVVLATLNIGPVRPSSRATTHQPRLPKQVIRQRNGVNEVAHGHGIDTAGPAGIGSTRFG